MKNIYYWLSLPVIIPLIVLFGFYTAYLLEATFYTPLYEKYNKPLITDYWLGCEIYTEMPSTTEDFRCYMKKDWYQCRVYNNWIKGIKNNIKD
jgi:hypothetical protein